MQQIILNIKNENIMDKLLWMLKHFKNDGVEIRQLKTKNQEPTTKLSDEYMEKNWREILMGIKSDPDYYKSKYAIIDNQLERI